MVSVGLPFFAVATNAPLLQRWFSHTRHSDAADPYFLYGASNLGSILALLAYPAFIEPVLGLQAQSWAWASAYAVLVALIGVCAVILGRRYVVDEIVTAPVPDPITDAGPSDSAVTWPRRLHWMALAFVPSSLLLGVTAHITTDVAAVPLLWVVPLVLYLLTFVFVFARKPLLKHAWMVKAQAFLMMVIALMHWWVYHLPPIFFFVHMAVFFVTAMVCHGELVKRRPAAEHLTEFYLWMSFGGMLGGVFNVLVAPVVFDTVYEYPLVLILACMLRPNESGNTKLLNWRDVVFPGIILTAFLLPDALFGIHPLKLGLFWIVVFFVAVGLTAYSFNIRPFRFAFGIGAIFLATTLSPKDDSPLLARERSFFGVNAVTLTHSGAYNVLMHGTTVHGAQHTDSDRWRKQLTYYHRDGPLGQLFAAIDGKMTIGNIGVLGLGSGTMACYRRPGQTWTLYEIDPVVVKLALDTRYFRYLSECAGDSEIVLGDARLSLAREPEGYFDLLIMDAFTSDAIPMHLITREAMALYLGKLAEGGLIAFNISNRNLDLSGVMGNLVKDAGLVPLTQRFPGASDRDLEPYKVPAYWVVVARNAAEPDGLELDDRWKVLAPDPGTGVWTDDYSNILTVLKWWTKKASKSDKKKNLRRVLVKFRFPLSTANLITLRGYGDDVVAVAMKI